MKNIFSITFFLLFTSNLISQVNGYFENNPVWHVEKATYSGWDCSGTDDSYNYYINGDTVINTLVYKKIFKRGIIFYLAYDCDTLSSDFYENTTPSFFLRSLDKKMFMYIPEQAVEVLLYDFDLVIGDTLPDTYTYNISNSSYPMVVQEIDSVSTPNGFLKKFKLSNDNDFLFEGAGSTGGLEESVFRSFLSGSHALWCYSLESTTYFPEAGSFSCYFNVNVPEFKMDNTTSVYPNPFSQKTKIQFNHAVDQAILHVYMLNGTMVRKIVFSGSSIEIEREELNPGVYYFEIVSSERNTMKGKLIVTDND